MPNSRSFKEYVSNRFYNEHVDFVAEYISDKAVDLDLHLYRVRRSGEIELEDIYVRTFSVSDLPGFAISFDIALEADLCVHEADYHYDVKDAGSGSCCAATEIWHADWTTLPLTASGSTEVRTGSAIRWMIRLFPSCVIFGILPCATVHRRMHIVAEFRRHLRIPGMGFALHILCLLSSLSKCRQVRRLSDRTQTA